jgi:hypothetical protein
MSDDVRQLLAFNRGVISSIGLARIDLQRYAMSAEVQKNYVPRVLGSMMLRPGTQYIDTMNEDLNLVRQMPFIFEEDDTALLEFGVGAYLRVRINDVLLVRPAVATTITNEFFVDAQDTSPPTGWTIDDDLNCDSFILNNTLHLRGSGEGFARTYQTITVAGPDIGVEHGIGIGVQNGPVRLRIGSTVQGSEYVFDELLDKGAHSIAITPTGDFTIELSNDRDHNIKVSNCSIVQDTIVQFTTPWSVEDQVRSVRWEQSGDRIYCSADGIQQKVIERRLDGRSWSLVDYVTDDGPFRVQNVGSTTLEVNRIAGDYNVGGGGTTDFAVLTASEPIFKIPHQGDGAFGPGALFRVASSGQVVTNTAGAQNVFTDPIRVVGAEDARRFGIVVEGVFVATVTLQFAFSDTGPWNDQGQTWTSPIVTSFDDGQDGAIIYYRLIVKTGDFTSGSVTMTLNYEGGSVQGIARLFERVDEENFRVHILKSFGSLEPSTDWWESEWSGVRGFPTAVAIHEGRLFWGGQDRIWASVSDAFYSHDDNTVGDSGPISRTIGSGAIRVINWMMSMARLIMGTSEHSANIAGQKMDGNNPLSARSTTFEEPLTPFNFNIKTVSSRGVFVDRTRQRLYELLYDVDVQDYKSMDLSIFAPDFNIAGIVQIAVQMKPDIRVHCVRSDGTVGMLVYDRLENVIAWVDIELGGVGNWCIEDVAVLPGLVEDQVYYTVKAFNATGEERFLLKWSLETEAIGGLNNYMADAWHQYDGAPTDLLVGLEYLQGLTVTVWADGVYEGTGVVTQFGSPGELDLTDLTLDGQPNSAAQSSNVIVGLQYTAQYKSTKLAAIDGIGLLERKKVNRLGFIAENLHHRGIQYGPDFDQLYDLPAVEEGQVVATDFIHETYHEDDFPFGGEWDPDSRICLQSESPKPATIIAAVAEYESVEHLDRNSR